LAYDFASKDRRIRMKNIELIIFDLDGCMVHTQPDIALAF
jgi:hypothetical protein